ncbi:helix-turn-helix domain-containing protein [Enterococcus raffinosus]|uniref:Helix-turn-helix transcriptional regulator n=2 Tax=Enterococcus TaxID=1350 RepID=A0AAW8TI57_9ENTE|nr:helix-turn-helix transcriptional regulator [Enterococcus raffinosus]MDT2546797.1 helix-turn-helix transcriptional regulator [Enterococcus raffinosus]
MRGTKTVTKFAEELGMTKSNYSKIELGRTNASITTLQRIAKLTNSTLLVDLIPNEPNQSEQIELEIEKIGSTTFSIGFEFKSTIVTLSNYYK